MKSQAAIVPLTQASFLLRPLKRQRGAVPIQLTIAATDKPDAGLEIYNPSGSCVSWRLAQRLTAPAGNDSSIDLDLAVYEMTNDSVLVRLSPTSTGKLLALSRDEVESYRTNLISHFLHAGRPIDALEEASVAVVLYLEPKADLRSEGVDIVESLRQMVAPNIYKVNLAQRVMDCYVAKGLLGGWRHEDLTVVRTVSLQGSENAHAIRLPWLVPELARAQSVLADGKGLLNELRLHPFMMQPPLEYASNVVPKGSVQTLRAQRKLSRAYDTFMSERLAALDAQPHARHLAGRFVEATKYLEAAAAVVDERITLTGDWHPRPHDGVVNNLLAKLNDTHTELGHTIEELASRDRMLADYFRDELNASVANSNLSLQRSLRILTFVGATVAVLTLAAMFYLR